MTIEKANKDFNQLIEQNGFINTGAQNTYWLRSIQP